MPSVSQDIEVIQATRRAATLLHPLRIRILDELREPDSASGLARRLGLPRQKVNYHLRELERQGLLEPVEERRKGNCIERVVRATARSYLISPSALGALGAGPEHVRDRFSSAYLVSLAARAIRELTGLRQGAQTAGRRLPSFALDTEIRFANPADRKAFTEELAREIGRLVSKFHDEKAPGGRWFRFLLGAYPRISRREKQGSHDDVFKENEGSQRRD